MQHGLLHPDGKQTEQAGLGMQTLHTQAGVPQQEVQPGAHLTQDMMVVTYLVLAPGA
jgi:hypothetical protein